MRLSDSGQRYRARVSSRHSAWLEAGMTSSSDIKLVCLDRLGLDFALAQLGFDRL